ncbi:AEC family transporter [Aquimarina litoralis]|uniref:AEC family transporter n=1 Tax=Aquimarina litoralis TaxID=584605 RepID=UPI001C578F66|nr:permease [Aquimarina litoralis]MBW1297854.1 permease [Aquimarina litoralis]
METTIQKTIVFGVFILIGFLLKRKFTSKAETQGLKKIILNLALPATIFIALMGVDVDPSLLTLPFLALVINGLLFWIFPFVLPMVGFKKNTPEYRTLRLLLPSLAPGLSCFPFIAEILGPTYLAKAAMADLGNKIFVLIILYCVAVHWFMKISSNTGEKQSGKLKSLITTLLSEPVTVLILVAIGLLSFGFSFQNLPNIAQDVLQKLSLLMTPLVMIFIGLSVKIRKDQFIKIVSVLILRAGIVLLISAGIVGVMGITIREEILWLVSFTLSACSFWPYAHIASISEKEKEELDGKKTFRNGLAINVLAISFPLSTVMIMGIMLNPSLVGDPYRIILLGIGCIGIGVILTFWIRYQEIKDVAKRTTTIGPKQNIWMTRQTSKN